MCQPKAGGALERFVPIIRLECGVVRSDCTNQVTILGFDFPRDFYLLLLTPCIPYIATRVLHVYRNKPNLFHYTPKKRPAR